ncbi:MAG: helix-turn-helix transcriptional regulator, partial [Beijerinckiaceae bacterium]
LQSLQAATPLAFWRNKRMISQTQLAATVGVSQSYIANLEAGKRKGDPALFMKLARALSVRIEDLIEHD